MYYYLSLLYLYLCTWLIDPLHDVDYLFISEQKPQNSQCISREYNSLLGELHYKIIMLLWQVDKNLYITGEMKVKVRILLLTNTRKLTNGRNRLTVAVLWHDQGNVDKKNNTKDKKMRKSKFQQLDIIYFLDGT